MDSPSKAEHAELPKQETEKTWEAPIQVTNESGKEQPWRKWLPKDEVPCSDKPWIGWKPDPQNESAKPWVDWVKSGGIEGAGPSGNAGG